MALTPLNTIKNWFKTNLIPSQDQFWDMFDSFRHKSDKVAATDVDGLNALLAAKASNDVLTNHTTAENAHAVLFGQKVDKVAGKGLSDQNYSLPEKEKVAGIEAFVASQIATVVVGSTNLGSLTPLSTIPVTIDVHGFATEAGTYTNCGGLVVPVNSFAFLSRVGGVWAMSRTELELMDYAKKEAFKQTSLISLNGISHPNLPQFFNSVFNPGIPKKLNIVPNYFKNLGLQYAIEEPCTATLIKESYLSITVADGLILPKQDQYYKYSFYLYAPGIDLINEPSRLRPFWLGGTQFTDVPATMTKVDDNIYYIQGIGKFTGNLASKDTLWFEVLVKKVDGTNFLNTDKLYFTGLSMGYSYESDFELKDSFLYDSSELIKLELLKKDYIEIPSIVVGGNYEDLEANFDSLDDRFSIENPTLKGLGLSKIKSAVHSGNVEVYTWISGDNDLKSILENAAGKFVKINWLVFSKNDIFPTSTASGRVGVSINYKYLGADSGLGVMGSNTPYPTKHKRLSYGVFEIEGVFKLDFPVGSTINYAFIANVLESADVPVGYSFGDFGMTGLKMAIADTELDFEKTIIQKDWLTLPTVKNITNIVNLSSPTKSYNNLPHNSASVSNFLRKHSLKEVDDFNQLSIIMAGDSIFGRLNGTELPYTQDTNGGTGNGYTTGHFPPNMWAENVGFKLLQLLQFSDADVKYFNHVSSEITKTGTWTDLGLVGADNIRLSRTNETNATIKLAFSGASFAKFIYSNYGNNGKTRRLKFTISDDAGATWQDIVDAGLISSIELDIDSALYLPNLDYKWGNVIIAGFNPSNSYILRVQKIDSAGALDVWGFETWSKPRVNVIITAEGGNVAESQLANPQRFCSKMYNPSLVIYEMPYLNDLGSGMMPNYGTGYEAEENTRLSEYNTANDAVLKRLSQVGVEVLTLITHSASFYPSRVFAYTRGLSVIRNLISKYGFGSLDVNKYFFEKGYTSTAWSDGTHLSSIGVQMYIDILSEVLNVPQNNKVVASSTPAKTNNTLYGSGSGAGTIDFGFEFCGIPKVRIFGNISIVVNNVTNSSFTTTGSGAFDYEVYLE